MLACHDIVHLEDAEYRVCVWLGKQRFLIARARGWRARGAAAEQLDEASDICGACCEFAAAVILNLYWRPQVGRRGIDVGGLVEVRSTNLKGGRLIIKPDDHGPHILIRQLSERDYDAPGWLDAAKAKGGRYPLDATHGEACWFVPQGDLDAVAELRRMVHLQVAA
jgi:hypothetical protein